MKLDPNSAEGLLAYAPSFHQQRSCLTYSLCLFNVQSLGIFKSSKKYNTMQLFNTEKKNTRISQRISHYNRMYLFFKYTPQVVACN